MRFLFPLVAVLLLSPPHGAADHWVGPGQSIQAAIDAAADGDRIWIQPGSYAENLDLKGKAIELIGVEGAQHTAVVGGGRAPTIVMHRGEGPGTRLKGLTISGGRNLHGLGGGLAGVPVVPGLPVAAPTIEDCIVTDNLAYGGAGLAADATLVRTSIGFNRAVGGLGGGVLGAVSMRDCVVADNFCIEGAGAGLATEWGALDVERCTFYSNFAVSSRGGSAIYVGAAASGRLRSTLVVGNDASLSGVDFGRGTVRIAPGGELFVERCTIADNGGFAKGSGVFGPAVLTNSIVHDNWGNNLGGGATASYCNVGGGWPGVGNIDMSPGFVSASLGDYQLRPTSPSVDAGDPAKTDPDGTVVDQGALSFSDHYPLRNAGILDWTQPAFSDVSATVGGCARMNVFDPDAVGALYVVLGSFRPPGAGLAFQGLSLPLAPDELYGFLLRHPNTAPYVDTAGVLTIYGAPWSLELPAGLARELEGSTLSHVAVLFDPTTLVAITATDVATVTVVP